MAHLFRIPPGTLDDVGLSTVLQPSLPRAAKRECLPARII